MKIEIVSHCINYSRILCFQLSSLIKCKSDDVGIAIVSAEDDYKVRSVVNFFKPLLTCPLRDIVMTRNEVCNRAIGRNHCAKTTSADFCWMIDCDYCLGDTAVADITAALDALPPEVLLAFPGQVMASKNHAAGDSEIAKCRPPQVIHIDKALYQPQRISTAIGGLQFVRGRFLRENGYLSTWKRLMRPVADGKWPKRRTIEDHHFRNQFNPEQRVRLAPVLSLFRLRHGTRGGLDGEVDL